MERIRVTIKKTITTLSLIAMLTSCSSNSSEKDNLAKEFEQHMFNRVHICTVNGLSYYVDKDTRVVWVHGSGTSHTKFWCPIPNADGTFKTYTGELPKDNEPLTEEMLKKYLSEEIK